MNDRDARLEGERDEWKRWRCEVRRDEQCSIAQRGEERRVAQSA